VMTESAEMVTGKRAGANKGWIPSILQGKWRSWSFKGAEKAVFRKKLIVLGFRPFHAATFSSRYSCCRPPKTECPTTC